MSNTNEMLVEFEAVGENESFARVVIAAFVTRLNPTLEELGDIKVAVSEAVTNAIIHGYEEKGGKIRITARLKENELTVQIEDWGKGIPDVEKAMEPLFTTKPEEERSGMGFSFMEAFTDELLVESKPGEGTRVTMKKVMGVQDGSNN
ncbi:MAG: anti-sigma F factor [Lachnospiraceae bacterium]|nr:anti-sigma F factor [Lachnospiraceae bacterium]MBP3507393.1 anti-sigma F factor [Lachnospiraceae bacterium]